MLIKYYTLCTFKIYLTSIRPYIVHYGSFMTFLDAYLIKGKHEEIEGYCVKYIMTVIRKNCLIGYSTVMQERRTQESMIYLIKR